MLILKKALIGYRACLRLIDIKIVYQVRCLLFTSFNRALRLLQLTFNLTLGLRLVKNAKYKEFHHHKFLRK